MMFTTDLSLKMDPDLRHRIALQAEPAGIRRRLARAWFKLTHRDMGPRASLSGAEVPAQEFLWQDPIPPADHALIDAQ